MPQPHDSRERLAPRDLEQVLGAWAEPVTLSEPELAALERAMLMVPVNDLMIPVSQLPIAAPAESLNTVVERMNALHFGYTFICEQRGKALVLLGIFTERDYLLRIHHRLVSLARERPDAVATLLDSPIKEFMTAQVQFVQAGWRVLYALRKMSIGGYRRLAVVELCDQVPSLVGAFSERTIAQYIIDLHQKQIVFGPETPQRWAHADGR